jgi:hypothetical protein
MSFNESTKDVFVEYKLEWISDGEPDEMTHDRLSAILKYARSMNIKNYKISALTKEGVWKLLMKIGK